MKKLKIRLAVFLAIMIGISTFSLPTQQNNAHALTIRYRYRIVYRRIIKHKKKIPKLSDRKITTTKGEIEFIKLKNATAKKVKWYSSNKKIATVKRDGSWCAIKAKKKGKVTVTAKYKGKRYKCRVTVKKKKAKAFYCYLSPPAGTKLRFKRVTDPYTGAKEWMMYDYDTNDYYNFGMDIDFDSDIYPISLTFEIDDESIMKCEWDEDEDVEWFKLLFYPQKAGTTYLRITNSYNSQTMVFPIVCEVEEDNYEDYYEDYL